MRKLMLCIGKYFTHISSQYAPVYKLSTIILHADDTKFHESQGFPTH